MPLVGWLAADPEVKCKKVADGDTLTKNAVHNKSGGGGSKGGGGPGGSVFVFFSTRAQEAAAC